MQLEVGKKYTTKSGNIIQCKSIVDGKLACTYVKINAEGHDVLLNTTSLWEPDGRWSKNLDGSIHDVKE